jgi:hypothetical protein
MGWDRIGLLGLVWCDVVDEWDVCAVYSRLSLV